MSSISPVKSPLNNPIIQDFLKPEENSCLLFCSNELTINNNVYFRSRKIDGQKLFKDFSQQVDQRLISCYDLSGVQRPVRGSEEHSALQEKISNAIDWMMDTRSGVSDNEITHAIEKGIFPDRMVKAFAEKISEEYDIPERDRCLPQRESFSGNENNRGPDANGLYTIGEKNWLCNPPRFITPMNVCKVTEDKLIQLRWGTAISSPVETGKEPTDEQKSYWVQKNFCRVAPHLADYCGSKKSLTEDVPNFHRVRPDSEPLASQNNKKVDSPIDYSKISYNDLYLIAKKMSDSDLRHVYSNNKFVHDNILSGVNERLERSGSSIRISEGDRDVIRGVYMLIKTTDMNSVNLRNDVLAMANMVTNIVINRN